jgi:hypothetical protein
MFEERSDDAVAVGIKVKRVFDGAHRLHVIQGLLSGLIVDHRPVALDFPSDVSKRSTPNHQFAPLVLFRNAEPFSKPQPRRRSHHRRQPYLLAAGVERDFLP